MTKYQALLLTALMCPILLLSQGTIPIKNGFRLSDLRIPAGEIRSGGPPKDGIPAIDRPVFIAPERATFLGKKDEVLGVFTNGVAKAYPIRIMDRHEVVNDTFAGIPVAVTYCPLCRSGVAYLARNEDKRMTFGVSGLLYNSDVLLYDRETESLWSQIMSQAISGPASGTKLNLIPARHTTWEAWRRIHPNTLVLSTDTGFTIDYRNPAYETYNSSDQLMFPVSKESSLLANKDLVVGIEIQGKFKAYPFKKLKRLKEPLADTFNGLDLLIHYDKKSKSARITDAGGKDLPAISMFWFAWYAFHPETEVYP